MTMNYRKRNCYSINLFPFFRFYFAGRNGEHKYDTIWTELCAIDRGRRQDDNMPCRKSKSDGTLSGDDMEIECRMWVF